MKFSDLDRFKTVMLSRRNLAGLLSQLDNYAGTKEQAQIMRRQKDGTLLIVLAEEDAVHYDDDEHKGLAGSSGPGQKYAEQISA